MRKLKLGFMVLVALLSVWWVTAQDPFNTDLIRLVNQARASNNVPPLVINLALNQAAQAHSEDMARMNNLTHVGSDGSQFWQRAERFGYIMINGSQNVLSRTDLVAQNVFNDWQASITHNANMLNADYQEIGLGYARAANGTYFFTMLFGTRADFVFPTNTPQASATPNIILSSNTPSSGGFILPSPTVLITAVVASPTPQIVADSNIQTLIAPRPTNTPAPLRPTNTPNPFATATIGFPTLTPSPVNTAELRLFMSADGVILQNISGRFLDISQITLENQEAILRTTRWDNGFLGASLFAFPNNDCLQAWGLNVNQAYARPAQCRARQGWVAVNSEANVWNIGEEITVRNQGVIVQICDLDPSRATTCDINLEPPQNAIVDNNTNTNPQPIAEGVIRVMIQEDSVTVINLTGSDVNLSNWIFESANAQMFASAWNTTDASRNVGSLPNNDCVQVWGVNTELRAKPEACRVRHSWIAVGANRQFWLDNSFTISDRGTVLATCNPSNLTCDIGN
jgi:hypothetical protein